MTRTVVGRYEIREEIGRGGTATVYLAYQTDLRRRVALKELSALSAADPTFARRFVRESWVSASLSHPNLVTVHDYFEADGAPFIAMEYLPNGSLRSRVGVLSLGQVAGVLEAMLGGLSHAHANGVVHRDLKPENVLVTADGGVKIADFGIAKALDSVDPALTVTGTTIGTPTYMAPEQATAGDVGARTDLYSVGIMAFEMIAGRPPFGGAEPVAILLGHVKDSPPPLTRVAPSTDPAVSDWVARLLEKDPEDRPGSAADAWDALEEIVLGALGPRWQRDARLATLEATPAPPAYARTPPTRRMIAGAGSDAGEDPRLLDTVPPRAAPEPPVTPKPRKRHTWRVALGLIVVGWALAALLMGALRSSSAPTPPASGSPPAARTAEAVHTPSPTPAATDAPAPSPTPAATDAPAPGPTPAATDAPAPDPTPAATDTPAPSRDGVGDSRSDDPSDDAPGSEDDPEADGPDP